MPILRKKSQAAPAQVFAGIGEGLKSLYFDKILPLEETYLFEEFHSPKLDATEFTNKPMVLLVGQYSVGKTTFIKHILEEEFPGIVYIFLTTLFL